MNIGVAGVWKVQARKTLCASTIEHLCTVATPTGRSGQVGELTAIEPNHFFDRKMGS